MIRLLLTAFLISLTAGCARANGEHGKTAAELASAVESGRVTFEVRGFRTDVNKQSSKVGTIDLSSTTFTHRASVVALGDSALTKAPMWLVLRVKRISGGDPSVPREENEWAVISMRGGVGELTIGRGYRNATDTWEQEHVEVTPLGVMPIAPLTAASVKN